MHHDAFSLKIDPDDPASLERALKTEWLLTNGIGGYAMGTALGVNTRRYHGLLVAATNPPVGRIVALHSLLEQILVDDQTIDLSAQQFGEDCMLHPAGYQQLGEFRFEPNRAAHWIFRAAGMRITKTLAVLPGRNGLTLKYEVEGARKRTFLRLRPFTPLRDFHSLLHDREGAGTAELRHGTFIRFHRHGHDLDWFGQICDWRAEEQWWRQFAYVQDFQRGQEFREDLWSAGYLQCEVRPGQSWQLSLAIAVPTHGLPDRARTESAPPITAARRERDMEMIDRLKLAAEQFIVRRCMGDHWSTSVLAGYPWFGDWGRDTMIALPGLMLCTNRVDDAKATLITFARSVRNGLLPNLFDDYGGAAHYNTVDASLWFVHAVREWWKVADDSRDVREELLNACRQIINAYRTGTDFNIRMDEDALIIAGDESTQLTWMDAKRDNVVFTARHGKAVEINALWMNALHALSEMSEDEAEAESLAALRDQAAGSFRQQFWWEQRQCLHDVLVPREDAHGGWAFVSDERVRPNQVFAVSLPFSPLDRHQQRAVVKLVGERLLTPFGLRTLDPADPQYCPRFEGDLFCRDRAYHNGTVWPWLIGPYCEALLRSERFSAGAKRKVRTILQPLLRELEAVDGGCINQLAEVYDGDAPQRAGGCPAQAWSVAEVLRITAMIQSPARRQSSIVNRQS
jgi:predicted glycogen debranching enzyme